MRCPSCNKFATYDTSAEPESDGMEVTVEKDGDAYKASIGGQVRIVLTAECCGDELKEATFDVDIADVDVVKAVDCTCEGDTWWEDAEAESDGMELTDRNESTSTRTKKDGTVVTKPIPYRFQKRFFGAEGQITIQCPCGKEIGSEHWSDEIQASAMDELV